MKKENFEVGEIVAFIGQSYGDKEIYSVEIGEIKRKCSDGAFVYYHTGDTCAKTNYIDLYKIDNLYAFDIKRRINNE